MELTFNEWRSRYFSLTDKENKEYHNYLETKYPVQAHFSANFVTDFFDTINREDITVTEVGGWKGDLANEVLGRFSKVVNWRNIEFCPNAVDKSVVIDSRYSTWCPDNFRWWEPLSCILDTVFICTHVFEHLHESDIKNLMDIVHCEYLFIEAPLEEYGQSWDNYSGTHIYFGSRSNLISVIESFGYKVYKEYDKNCISYKLI